MDYWYICPVCFSKNEHPFLEIVEDFINNEKERDYIKKCPNGHEFLAILENEMYRIIFDEAVLQHQSGFYNNSVLNAYTALEEFMKFFIRFRLYLNGAPIEDVIKVAKRISKSERKKGAFIYTYYEEFDEIKNIAELDDFAELRNSIIHDGLFINNKSAIDYLQNIYNFINDIVLKLDEKYTIDDYLTMNSKLHKYYKEKYKVNEMVGISIPHVLNGVGEVDNNSFLKKYKSFKITKQYSYINPFSKKVMNELTKLLENKTEIE